METLCFDSSLETWLRQTAEGETQAWLHPSLRGQPRIEKPPLLIWLNMAAWSGLTPTTATVEELAWRARLVTVVILLAGVAATGLIAALLAGSRAGILAMTVTGSFFLAVKYGHYATYDAQLMGWTTLAVAAAFWAVGPNRASAATRPWHALGWLPAGLALTAAYLTKGPVCLVWALPPILLAILLSPTPWRRHAAGLGLALLPVLAAALWWGHQTIDMLGHAMAKNALCGEYLPVDESQKRPVFIYLMLPGLLLPWSAWWSLACRQSFSEPDPARRRAAWLAGGWFAVTLLFACLWPMRQERYLLPILPAAGLMTALYLDGLEKRHPTPLAIPWLRRVWAGTWSVLALMAGGTAVYLVLEPWLLGRHWIGERLFNGIAPWQSLAIGSGLASLCAIGWWLLRHRQIFATQILLGLWMCGFSTFCYFGYSQAEHQRYAAASAAERLRAVGTTPQIWYLRLPGKGRQPAPNPGLAVFSLHIIQPITPSSLAGKIARGETVTVLVAPDSPAAQSTPLEAFPLQFRGDIHDTRRPWRLFQTNPSISVVAGGASSR